MGGVVSYGAGYGQSHNDAGTQSEVTATTPTQVQAGATLSWGFCLCFPGVKGSSTKVPSDSAKSKAPTQ